MEENYIVLNKWDIEDLIGNSGCAAVEGKQYYRDEIIIRAPVLDANPESCFTYYKIRKANSRQITEYY